MNPLEFSNWVKIFFLNINDFFDHKYKNNPNAFTRKRKLSLESIIAYPLVKDGHSGAVDGYYFLKFIINRKFKSITRQAIAKKRKLINPIVYKDMNKRFISKIYENTEDLKKFKDYLVLSIDGSELALPNSESTRKKFPSIIKYFFTRCLARARISCVLDSHSKLILDILLVNKKEDEITLAIKHLKNLKDLLNLKKTIFVFDRGYNSMELMLQMKKCETNFIIRLKKNTFAKEINKMQTNDEYVKIAMTGLRRRNIEDPEILEMAKKILYFNIRVTKVTLESGEQEMLISNLNKKQFSPEDLKELYNKRWKIETGFDFLKNVMNIENFSSYDEKLIKQDFYSKILLYNISMTMKNYVEAVLRQEKKLKPDKAVNFSNTAGIIKCELKTLIQSKKLVEITRILDEIIEYLKKDLIKVNRTLRKDMGVKNPDHNKKFKDNKKINLL